VAGRTADLLDPDQERIGIAVEADFPDVLHVATLLAFPPQPLPAAAVVADAARAQCFFVGIAVHVGEHQHIAGCVILGNDGDEICLVEIGTTHETIGSWRYGLNATKVPETCRITPVRKEYQGGGLALASAQLEEDFCGGVELIQVEPFVGGMGLLDGPWTEDDGWQASG
jgi:hypothetical protein